MNRQCDPFTHSTPHGFMLIELAVAAMVISIGVLALLGLAHIGERAATDTENETRVTLFADEVFTTLRLYSDHASETGGQKGWLDFWTSVAQGKHILPVANQTLGSTIWQELDEPSIVGDGTGTGVVHTNVWPDATADAPFYAFQYRLTLSRPTTNQEPDPTSVLFLDPDISPTNTVWATLHVWNGRFRRHPEPFTFYTHFADPGGLP